MKRVDGLAFWTVFWLTVFGLLGWGSYAFISWSNDQERERKEALERAYWLSPTFFFKPVSCRDYRNGDDCAILLTPGVGSYLAFPYLRRVYVEGTLGTFDQRPVKLVVEHGKPGKFVKDVPPGYKLVMCYCDQEECLIRTPDSPVYMVHNRVHQGLVFTKNKPE